MNLYHHIPTTKQHFFITFRNSTEPYLIVEFLTHNGQLNIPLINYASTWVSWSWLNDPNWGTTTAYGAINLLITQTHKPPPLIGTLCPHRIIYPHLTYDSITFTFTNWIKQVAGTQSCTIRSIGRALTQSINQFAMHCWSLLWGGLLSVTSWCTVSAIMVWCSLCITF